MSVCNGHDVISESALSNLIRAGHKTDLSPLKQLSIEQLSLLIPEHDNSKSHLDANYVSENNQITEIDASEAHTNSDNAPCTIELRNLDDIKEKLNIKNLEGHPKIDAFLGTLVGFTPIQLEYNAGANLFNEANGIIYIKDDKPVIIIHELVHFLIFKQFHRPIPYDASNSKMELQLTNSIAQSLCNLVGFLNQASTSTCFSTDLASANNFLTQSHNDLRKVFEGSKCLHLIGEYANGLHEKESIFTIKYLPVTILSNSYFICYG